MSAQSFSSPGYPVVDGLVYFCDGDPAPLKTGGVTAANVTVTHMLWDLPETFAALGRWHKILADHNSPWVHVKMVEDIYRAYESGKVGLIMGWQNALPIGSELDRVAAFHALGIRVIQLTYNEANLAGDGCLEPRDAGLTEFGVSLVHELNTTGIAIDLSHCGNQATIEAARASTKPVLVTHANAYGLDPQPRNKSDEALHAVASGGGVIGASIHGFLNWDGNPENPPTLQNFVRHVQYIVDKVGIEHVGIGTDFSVAQTESSVRDILEMSRRSYPETGGKYAEAFGNDSASRYPRETPTAAEFPLILDALEEGGFSDSEIEAIAGGNLMRVFGAVWG